jgi:hypothetical protein
MSDDVNQTLSNPTADTTQRTAEAAAVVFSEMIASLAALRSGSQRAGTALIAYMDRVILLAGGTLTLVFTVLGGLSAHLFDTGQQARHVPFILASCWLLVATIVAGLLYNTVSIKLGGYLDFQNTLATTDVQLKLKILSVSPGADVSRINAIPLFAEASHLKTKIKSCERGARIFGFVAQCALVSAFFFLALFIQANVWIMLVTGHHK